MGETGARAGRYLLFRLLFLLGRGAGVSPSEVKSACGETSACFATAGLLLAGADGPDAGGEGFNVHFGWVALRVVASTHDGIGRMRSTF